MITLNRKREMFHVWTKSVETFVLEVLFGERRGTLAKLVRRALFMLSKIFQVGLNDPLSQTTKR